MKILSLLADMSARRLADPNVIQKSAQNEKIMQSAVQLFKGGRHVGQDIHTGPDHNINGNVVYYFYVVSNSK